jgi:hypothetical protein
MAATRFETRVIDPLRGEYLAAKADEDTCRKDTDQPADKCGVSYFVSALIHPQGQYGSHAQDMKMGGGFWCSALVDLFFHLSLWIVLVGFDIYTATRESHGKIINDMDTHVYMSELQTGVIVATSTALVGLVICILLGFGGEMINGAQSFQHSLVIGGLKASILFSVIYALQLASMHPDVLDKAEAGSLNTFRQISLWAIVVKILAVYMVKSNVGYWFGSHDFNGARGLCALLSAS